MQNIDEVLRELGLAALPRELRESYRAELLAGVNRRIGDRLAVALPDLEEDLLDEFRALAGAPEAVRRAWLHINLPGYRRLVADETAAAVATLRAQAAELVALELAIAAPAAHQPSRERDSLADHDDPITKETN